MRFSISVLVFLSVLLAGCIDKDYDLNNFDSTISVGDEGSVFDIPLLDLKFPLSALQTDGGEKSVQKMFEEVDIWVPSSYSCVEVERLMSDEEYLSVVISDLLDECAESEEKLRMVVSLLEANHGDDFKDRLLEDGLPLVDGDLAAQVGYLLVLPYTRTQVQTILGEYAEVYLKSISYDTISYPIDSIKISSDIINALADADDDSRQLYIYGKIESSVPVDFDINPVFSNTDICLGILNVERDNVTPIGYTDKDYTINISLTDIKTIIEGNSEIIVPIAPKKYYPRSISSSQKFIISLKLRKTGALKF